MKTSKFVLASLLLMGFARSGVALADQTPMPHPVTQDGIRFIAGGVGDREMKAMHAVAKQYNLRVTFAMKNSGEYLANVNVSIDDASGRTLVKASSVGPDFFAALPSGHYQVVADRNGVDQVRSIYVDAHHVNQFVLYWPVSADQT
jgi:hypothetical protein